jgi:small subunit ribosomal protein S16
MSVKIRLQRHGKKGKPFYWVVAADARSKRDGKYLEKIGTYNPNTNPATIELDIDSAVKWLHNGAQPTETAKAILSYKGALLKHHLDGGIRKGALTQEQADAKLATWLEAKAGKVDAKKEGLTKVQTDAKAKALKAEKDVNAKRIATAAQAEADAIAAATPAVEEEVAEVEAATEEVETVAEVVAEAETTEEKVAEVETVAAPEIEAEVEATEEKVAEVETATEVVAEVETAEEENNETTEA